MTSLLSLSYNFLSSCFPRPQNVIQQAYVQTNYELSQRAAMAEAGSCAVTAVLTRSAGAMHLFCANAGDCRAVLYSGT